MTTAAGTARRRRPSSLHQQEKQTPSHKKTMDISSPEVANSHTPATTDDHQQAEREHRCLLA